MTSSNRAPGRPPRGSLSRLITPGPDSSTAQLRVCASVWALLLPVWVSAQWWSHPDTLRRWLYIVLSLVAITQALGAVAELRKRR